MPIQQFVRSVRDLHSAVANALKNDIILTDTDAAQLHDFKAKHREAMRTAVLTGIATVDIKSHHLFALIDADKANKGMVEGILKIVGLLGQTKDIGQLQMLVDDLVERIAELPKDEAAASDLPKLPADIRGEIVADHAELQKCMKVGAYRSAVVLCGRMLETALFRKYFEITGNDLLEKAPGTGLGNLVAKIAEHGATIDPALGNQIHLINQVRVHSVHKKAQPFNPSKQQAQAIQLYTLDVLGKLWS
ncbi:hypothetical protein HY493_01630 [Candidatus Woesearchaeota archaeon]|nr:hypothetical protein [Candidatus Woesearchaeota archaeon]